MPSPTSRPRRFADGTTRWGTFGRLNPLKRKKTFKIADLDPLTAKSKGWKSLGRNRCQTWEKAATSV